MAKKTKTDSEDVDQNDQGSNLKEQMLSEAGDFSWLKVAFVSLLLLWCSFPPLGLWWLAWIAIVPLIWIVLQPNCFTGNLSQRKYLKGRNYRQLYFIGLIYWLSTFYFIPIPHPALWVAWFLVSAYMAVYTPIFVGVSRTMIHRLKIPALIAIPVAWTGIEWIRSHFATGMALVCLSHTQYKQPIMIQVADLCGGYTLSFAMALFSTGIAIAMYSLGRLLITQPASNEASPRSRSSLVPIIVSIVTLALVLVYGNFRLNEVVESKNESVANVALIQSSHDVINGPMLEETLEQQFDNKNRLTQRARSQWKDLDLAVWPESALVPYLDITSDVDPDFTEERVTRNRIQLWSNATGYPGRFETPLPLLTGAGTLDPKTKAQYASAILINEKGMVENRYYKNHLVMAGEYIPFIEFFPFLAKYVPTTTAGNQFTSIEIKGVNLAPNICFESTVPHYIRRQINTLTSAGTEPDAMVNMTNDGWFFGTSCLDLHLACNVFRAVEMRKPNLVCANTGFSAEIDSCGRLIQTGPRRAEGVLKVEVRSTSRMSPYRKFGEVIPGLFGWIVVAIGAFGWWNRKR